MSNNTTGLQIPGFIYSLALAILAWFAQYLTSGAGSSLPWSPIALIIVPTIVKLITVASSAPAAPSATARGEIVAAPSKARRFWLG